MKVEYRENQVGGLHIYRWLDGSGFMVFPGQQYVSFFGEKDSIMAKFIPLRSQGTEIYQKGIELK